MKREDRFTVCIMCFGTDKDTQERLLKEREPWSECHLCLGSGGLEVEFKKGLDSNEVQTTGKVGKSGYPIVILSDEYNAPRVEKS